MNLFLLTALALQPAPAAIEQTIAPRTCVAEPNEVHRDRVQFQASTFRFAGRVTVDQLRGEQFVPAAVVNLAGASPPEELAIYLAIRPGTPQRYDVTLRRSVAGELRERSVLGYLPTAQGVDFSIDVAGNEAALRFGDLNATVPLRSLRPTSIDLACGSGSFRFENLEFSGVQTPQPAAAAEASVDASAEAASPTGQRLICRSRPRLGTRLVQDRRCMTAEQWTAYETDLEQSRRDTARRGIGCRPDSSTQC